MALTKSNYRLGLFPMPISQGAEVVSARAEITAAAAGAGDIFSMLVIPEDHILVDLILDSDDLDSNGAPTITLSVGYLLGDESDLDVTANVNGDGAAFIVASTIAQAAGMARPTTKSLWRAKARAAGDSADTPTTARRSCASSASRSLRARRRSRPARWGSPPSTARRTKACKRRGPRTYVIVSPTGASAPVFLQHLFNNLTR
jgi:hypothetical protein